MKILQYTEYLYVIVAILAIAKIVTLWGVEGSNIGLFVVFAVISIGMFIFRRSYRKKFEKHKDNTPS